MIKGVYYAAVCSCNSLSPYQFPLSEKAVIGGQMLRYGLMWGLIGIWKAISAAADAKRS